MFLVVAADEDRVSWILSILLIASLFYLATKNFCLITLHTVESNDKRSLWLGVCRLTFTWPLTSREGVDTGRFPSV